MISVKIDVTKIDKSRLFDGKNGAKYLDLILIESKNDKYGNDFMVKQSVSKSDREAGVNLPILGNAKDMSKKRPEQYQTPNERTTGNEPSDIPF